MWETAMKVLFLLLLVIGTWFDIRYRGVPRWLLLAGSGIAAAASVSIKVEDVWLYAGGCLLGTVFLLVSRWTKEAVGYADSWLIFILGLGLGIRKLLIVLSVAFFCSGILAAVLLFQKQKRKKEIAFIPFLLVGYLGVIGW